MQNLLSHLFTVIYAEKRDVRIQKVDGEWSRWCFVFFEVEPAL